MMTIRMLAMMVIINFVMIRFFGNVNGNYDDDYGDCDQDDELLLFWCGQGLPLMLMWRGGLQNMERWPRRRHIRYHFS